MSRDHHSKPYDEGTLLKLELFENYCKSWLPVFIQLPNVVEINIADFFCGPGEDQNGIPGSPLRIINTINCFRDILRSKNKRICTLFSDIKDSKVNSLMRLIDGMHTECVDIKYECLDFKSCFSKYEPKFSAKHAANLLFIDPTGLIDEIMLKKVLSMPRTDFILFIPAEHMHRFKNTKEFKNKLPGIETINTDSPKKFAGGFCKLIESSYTKDRDYYLAHFGIQKNSGSTHSVVFGSGSPLGIEKFLIECWKFDKDNGEASFSLEGDLIIDNRQFSLPGIVKGAKLRKFQESFRSAVLLNIIRNNKDAYLYAIKSACLPRHAKEVLAQLKKERKIVKVPALSYKKIFHDKCIEDIS
ncbi:three-Cys-motif partner protein TcmP [Desulfovibrio sulfodismutans]|uniref:Three-Cys-motif partner protein TcmP n=1 Tax=Desulfolutivibrio sulfodismutans TaxID=63561 RepID=A0A7K3NGI9_9BACT|nr:three-Cys-motif partner protein TcmP [Desulfolutivibrio sulfodismutans]NDY55306.1 three-Cys-motif partner protein TcmP [Desulfolutivibrio sulfodismutans]